MHKLGTVAFLLFGFAIVGYVTLFASTTQSQFTDLQRWVKDEGWEFERPGDRVSYRITAPGWTLEAIQGDKLAPPSLNAKPRTLWRSSEAGGSTSLVMTPFLPPKVYTNVEHRSENQRRLFEYILGEEAAQFSDLEQVPLPKELTPHFTLFKGPPGAPNPLEHPELLAELRALRDTLGHSPVIAAGPDGLSVRAQTMVFGPRTLHQLIQFSARLQGEFLRLKPLTASPEITKNP